jgi:hypothetical protein
MVDQFVARGLPLAAARRAARIESKAWNRSRNGYAMGWPDRCYTHSCRTWAKPGAG